MSSGENFFITTPESSKSFICSSVIKMIGISGDHGKSKENAAQILNDVASYLKKGKRYGKISSKNKTTLLASIESI